MDLKDQTLRKEKVLLKKDPEVHLLGRGLVLEDCEVISSVPERGLHVSEMTFVRGSFETKVKLANFRWCRAKLDGVRFIGHFSGNDFGKWPEAYGEHGDIRGCDFTAADVDNCRFFNCDVNSLRLPRWPWFTIRNPHEHARELQALRMPAEWPLMIQVYADSPSECSAVVGNAERIVREFGGTLEEVRAQLQTLSFVTL